MQKKIGQLNFACVDCHQVGANRWSGRIGVVLETVDRHENVGMVRIGGEEWRATTEGPPIGAGATVLTTGRRTRATLAGSPTRARSSSRPPSPR